MRRKTRKNQGVRVTGNGLVTGDQYLKLQEKLGIDLGDYQALLGISMKDHYLIIQHPPEALSDPGLCLTIRLLDLFPELATPEPEVSDLVQVIKEIKRDYPETPLPMSASAVLVALMLGRNGPTSTAWNTGRTNPPRKIKTLVRHLLTLLDGRDNPDRTLSLYLQLVAQEGKARGVADIFKERRWP